jgi:hypothetical protein
MGGLECLENNFYKIRINKIIMITKIKYLIKSEKYLNKDYKIWI